MSTRRAADHQALPAAAHVRLFGPPVLAIGSVERPLPTSRQGLLLALLAHQGDRLRRDQLASWLWPEHGQTAARTNLRNLLLRVRRLLHGWGAPGLLEQGDTVRWPVTSDWQDLCAARARGDWPSCLAAPDRPLLQGLDSDGQEVLDDLLRQWRGDAVELWRHAAVQRLASLADDAPARAELARQMLSRDPFDEDALLTRLLALRVCGQPGLATQELAHYRQRLADELGIAPSSRVRAALAPSPVHPAPPLPGVPGLVGRLDEAMALRICLAEPGCRLLVLQGPGGVGKSTLAAAVLPSVAARYADGVHWLRVEELADEEALVQRLRALWQLPAGDARALLRDHVATRQLLLVLDGAEHLDGIGPWLTSMLAAAPGLQLLLTSRRHLAAASAQRLVLGGLTLPTRGGRAGDAVALFEERARRADPQYTRSAGDDAVERIVLALEGLPLAIELAASWVDTLTPAQIAAQVAGGSDAGTPDVLALVGDAAAGGPAGLRASVARSWSLLTPPQRQALARLAWLPGAFGTTMATQGLGLPLAMLRSLVEASLLQGVDHDRFTLHALVRAVVRELGARERAWTQRHHARWLAASLAPARLAGTTPDTLVAAEWHHVAAAWRWALAQRDAATLDALAQPLRLHFAFAGRTATGLQWLGNALAALPDTPAARAARGPLMVALADLHCRSGDLATGSDLARQALRLATPVRDRGLARSALHVLGLAAHRGGQFARADRCWQQTLQIARELQDAAREAVAVNALAVNAMASGRQAEALVHFERALALDRALGAPASTLAMRLGNLGTAAYDQRRHAEARRWLVECLDIARGAGLSSIQSTSAMTLAMLLAEQGELDAARTSAAEACAAAEVTGQPYEQVLAIAAAAHVAWRRGECEPARQALLRALQSCTGDGPATQQATLQVMVLANVAEWLSSFGDTGFAAALAQLVQGHPACFASERLRVQ
ncbi:MAG: NACHT domain-containing protein, partial [Rhodoferax sp.]|nr:NACHT domain-containing protein [Rhodoferax sp.]